MRLISFETGATVSYGIHLPDGSVLDLVLAGVPTPTMSAFIAAGAEMLSSAKRLAASPPPAALRSFEDLRLKAPIPSPAKNIFCVGENYKQHITEGIFSDRKLPTDPEFFTKARTTVIAHLDVVPRHAEITSQLDYEGELAIVIGRDGANILAAQALDYVFGYTIVNDVTAREIQHGRMQWFKGKSLDGSCPMGPAIVTRDEIPDPSVLRLTTTVNGELRQEASLSDLIFDVPRIIADLSRGLTLEAGDIIATGTPDGVGYAREPPTFLGSGDEVLVRVTRLGELKNTVGPT